MAESAPETAPEPQPPRMIPYVQVTALIAVVDPDGHPIGDVMGDATLGFVVPLGLPDGEVDIEATITDSLKRVLAMIEGTFRLNGFAYIGQVDDPLRPEHAEGWRTVDTGPVEIPAHVVALPAEPT